jgi:hypothetical protein
VESQAALAPIKLGASVILRGSGTKRLIRGATQGLQSTGDPGARGGHGIIMGAIVPAGVGDRGP